MRTIYLDYNATTPLDPTVRDAMLPWLGATCANPSSIHHVGRHARAFLDDARDRLAAAWRCKATEVVFTSGGTESNNLAILGTARKMAGRGRHLIVSAVEHHAVLHPAEYLARQEGFALTVLPVDREGRVDPDRLVNAIRPETILVSVMAANNEVGTIQPVAEIGRRCAERGVLFHTDAVQWFGKEPFTSIRQFNADLVSVCAHKFCGPKGIGALFIRSGLLPDPILHGGAHENERRAGTENLAGIAGLVESFVRFVPTPVFHPARMSELRAAFLPELANLPGLRLWSPPTLCLNNTLALTTEECDSLSLLAGLDLEGVCASSGSACAAGSLAPSHVLSAMGASSSQASGLVRFSWGLSTSATELQQVAAVLRTVSNRVRNLGATSEHR